jgi:hypothetical protein
VDRIWTKLQAKILIKTYRKETRSLAVSMDIPVKIKRKKRKKSEK